MSIMPSVARLAAQTHESITITFEAEYRPATPGSSAWSIIAKNIRLRLVVPTERPLPNSVLAKMLARTSDPNPYALIRPIYCIPGGYRSRLRRRSSLSGHN
jgi:hypothetical protein